MKLLVRRDQKAGMLGFGKVAFTIDVRAEITAEERSNIKKYKLGSALLYDRDEAKDWGEGLWGAIKSRWHQHFGVVLSVNDLANGKRFVCKDVVEMLGVEDQIKAAAQTFKNVLEAAAHFGGEEILEIA
jgi:hypothetical protein